MAAAQKDSTETMTVIITAAGQGRRMRSSVNKQFLLLRNRPILAWTIEAFNRIPWVESIILVVPALWMEFVATKIVDQYGYRQVRKIIPGGEERQDSVFAGLKALEPSCRWVCIHDGVRPFLQQNLVERVFRKARETGAAIVGYPSRDTIKQANEQRIVKTVNRSHYWLVQTPQIFSRDIILAAYRRAFEEQFFATDDAGLVEYSGQVVHLVEGDRFNLKITTPEDLEIAEKILPLYFPEAEREENRGE